MGQIQKSDELNGRFEELVKKLVGYSRRADTMLVRRAWEFAKLAHGEERRISGELVVVHALATAEVLAEWKLDTAAIVVGLLHDTVEKGGAKQEDLVGEFGEEIASLVAGVTRVAKIRLTGSREEVLVENLRQMVLAMAKDLRVVLVKLASRLHNLESLSVLPQEVQERTGRETLDIYAPLAERLGMGEVKGVLEDLAFPFVWRGEYDFMVTAAKPYYKKADERVKEARQKILMVLAKQGIRGEANARKKHLYSLWMKLTRPEIEGDFEKINDIVALRVLVTDVEECYVALGLVHKIWKPVPNMGVSDFIAQPKPNGYRSIHTKVFGPRGGIMEVQIRTHQMHEEAEYGMAAHWHYSEAKARGASDRELEGESVFAPGEKVRWVKQLAAWQTEVADTQGFLEALKLDVLAHRIFVFSPQGDAYDLPAGATPVDFAYTVHTDLGRQATGARVNGKMVSLDLVLKSGDVVEIMKGKEGKVPTASWLTFVKTAIARREISKHLKQARKQDTIRE